MYREIALTKGHAGKALGGAKNAFSMGAVEAARLVDIMRQVRLDTIVGLEGLVCSA